MLPTVEHIVSGFGQMAGDGADGFSMPFSVSDSHIKLSEMAILPAFMIETDAIGRFDKSPLEVVVDVGAEAAEPGFASAGMDTGCGSGIGGQMFRGWEPADLADFHADDDTKDETHTGDRHQELNVWSAFQGLAHMFFDVIDLFLDESQLIHELTDGVTGVSGELIQLSVQGWPISGSEDIADLRHGESIFGQGGVDSVFEADPAFSQDHASAWQFPFVAQISRRNPHGGKCTISLQEIHSASVELVGLVNVAHHEFGSSGVDQLRKHAGRFDFVDDPVPVADGFHSDGRSGFPLSEKVTDGSLPVFNPAFVQEFSFGSFN